MIRTAASLCIVVLFLLGAAASPARDEPDQPTIRLTKTWTAAAPTGCGADQAVRLRKGRVPAGAQAQVHIVLDADRPTPLPTFEGVLVQWAAAHCLDGVSLQKAEGPTGADAFDHVEATGWSIVEQIPKR